MDINSKKWISNAKVMIKVFVLILLVIILLFLPNKTDGVILCLMIIWAVLRIKQMGNQWSGMLFFEHIHTSTRDNETVAELMNKTMEQGEIGVLLGKKYRKLMQKVHELQGHIQQAALQEKSSEEITNSVMAGVAKSLDGPMQTIASKASQLKEDDLDRDKLQELERDVDGLNHVIDELFELAKMTSNHGEEPLEEIELNALVSQALIDYEQRFAEAGLTFKKEFHQEKYVVRGNGEWAWRALQLLLDNIILYSKKGTRVYIKLEQGETYSSLTMLNISKNPLPPDVENLYSQLGKEGKIGLSMVTNLIDAQQGDFLVDLDGDLFKTVLFLRNPVEGEQGGEKKC